jgi:flagellar basal-body rod protein FlgB
VAGRSWPEGENSNMSGLLKTRTDLVLRGALDGLAARHRAFAQNMANVETPGFQPSDVPFEAELQKLRDELAANPAAVQSARPLALQEQPDDQGADRLDGNGVHPDRQIVRLAENTLTYEAVTQAVRLRGEMLRSAILEGRR